MDELLKKVKVALRLTIEDEELDDEINALILAARDDLRTNGIVDDDFANTQLNLTEQAIKLYVKGHWGYDNPDASRFLELYETLVDRLSVHSQLGDESNEV